MIAVVLGALLAGACGSGDDAPPMETPDAGDGAPPGYTRYHGKTMVLQPGESGIWAEYVSPPMDQAYDVVDVIGHQGPGGHHAIMYASSETQPVGTVREWTNADQLSVRFLGGSGGEGVGNIVLPEGLYFRVPQGNSLVLQTHYINTGDQPLEVTSFVDIKLEPASAEHTVAGLFVNVEPDITVMPGEPSLTVTCELQEEMDIVMWANHMHEWGKSVVTTAELPGGETIEVKRDDLWDSEWVVNPNHTVRQLDNPLKLPAGTKLHTQCTWLNEGNAPIIFPDEMCVFFSFNTAGHDVNCISNDWQAQ
jgi:hypothetical protein